ncbi:hypothetical protein PF010_g25915 [Phytophthora fragariae]|uniref:RxLR effector protein n=1 Tax=Phytophthora fragariae TaxID=53985 RepID=A0A6A4BEB1_9STRA|nr:hypothetical protein PF009_g31544 [Phytophthora fragariae]KAE9062280.1 hypothetical protein PF006_g31202 [Phytophthora fragariae]KAE9071320.1 hypothetical protein PF010_g25915 [Phytophthora fragariae]KAE9072394.1 hypothetical protein PF007_g26196 [Phytophthora fragariae]KAE9271183.1 hypothetical protein PF001_g28492 [Phytophthora fragariae]
MMKTKVILLMLWKSPCLPAKMTTVMNTSTRSVWTTTLCATLQTRFSRRRTMMCRSTIGLAHPCGSWSWSTSAA